LISRVNIDEDLMLVASLGNMQNFNHVMVKIRVDNPQRAGATNAEICE
jgi:hypothetical protein